MLIAIPPRTALVQASLSRPGEEAIFQEAVQRLGRMDITAAALCDRLNEQLRGAAPSPLVATGPLHPSWAAKAAQSKQLAMPGTGVKTVFFQDDE